MDSHTAGFHLSENPAAIASAVGVASGTADDEDSVSLWLDQSASGNDARIDLEQAWVWLQLAAGDGHALAARVRDRVATRLSPSALSDARSRLDNWTWPTAASYDDPPTVRYIQRGLARLGFPAGRDDGLAGPATDAAIEAFLEAQGTASTAAITPDLVARIRTALSGQ